MTDDLIMSLKAEWECTEARVRILCHKAADALEAQAKRIADAEANERAAIEAMHHANSRAEKAEAALAAARAALRYADHDRTFGWPEEHAAAVVAAHAAARGEQPSPVKSCETCAKKLIPTGCQDGDPALCWATNNSAWSSVDGMGPSGPVLQDKVREQPKSDVCPTCEGVVLGIGVCPACGTGKKETK